MTEKRPVFVDCTPDIAPYLDAGIRSRVPEIDIHFDAPSDEDDLVARLQGRGAALVYMAYLSRSVLERCPDLRTVVYLSTGLATHADMDAVAELGVDLTGVKGYGDRAVAEHAVISGLAALSRIAEADRAVRGGRFELMLSEEFGGKTFGLVGLGGIGRAAAQIAAAIGFRVIGWNRSAGEPPAGCAMAPLRSIFEDADIVSLHLTLGDETRGLIGPEHLACMKPGAILVNTARAGLIDEDVLTEGLKAGRPAHAALDVFHTEPLPAGHPLIAMDNVTLTSHSAWFTPQAIGRLLDAGFAALAEKAAGAEQGG